MRELASKSVLFAVLYQAPKTVFNVQSSVVTFKKIATAIHQESLIFHIPVYF